MSPLSVAIKLSNPSTLTVIELTAPPKSVLCIYVI